MNGLRVLTPEEKKKMLKTIRVCDSCGKVADPHVMVELITDRKTDPAGSSYDVSDQYDFCMECVPETMRILEKTINGGPNYDMPVRAVQRINDLIRRKKEKAK